MNPVGGEILMERRYVTLRRTLIPVDTIMANKLYAGDVFPSLTIDIVGGGSMRIPEDMDAKYKIIMFYRGHW